MDLSWFRIQTDIEELASKIRSSGEEFDHMLCVARGGLVIGGLLSHLIKVGKISSIDLKHYKGQMALEEVSEISPACAVTQGEKVLVVDDLVDTGDTAKFVHDKYGDDVNIKVAVLYDKTEGKNPPDFCVEEAPADEWITFPWEIGDE